MRLGGAWSGSAAKNLDGQTRPQSEEIDRK